MPHYLDQFGTELTNWTSQPIGNQETTFIICERDEKYTGVCFIDNTFYSQPFDHAPTDHLGLPLAGWQHPSRYVELEHVTERALYPRDNFSNPKPTLSNRPAEEFGFLKFRK